jgi:hypothetical protein
MGQFDNDATVVSIKNRMKMLSPPVDLDQYIGQITRPWNESPGTSGFGFTCKDLLSSELFGFFRTFDDDSH